MQRILELLSMNGVTAERKSIYEDFAAFGWVFGLGKNVRIVAPESVKEKMKKALEDTHGMYEPAEETPA